VELAPLTDPRQVPQMVATVLGVKEEAGRPVAEALVKYVKDRKLLLVLDNCEHVVLACAELAEALLKSGPLVRVLASSREHLHIGAEATYQVPALDVPDLQDTIAPEALKRYGGVQLFIDRAMAVQPALGDLKRGGCRRDLSALGRHSTGNRARSGARTCALVGEHRGAPKRSLPPIDDGRPDGASAPADAPRAGRLEL
jgi:hypothetical protein